MRVLIVCLLCLQACAFAYETIVESNDAHYDGERITLTGNVSVENGMGRVTAEEALLKKDSEKTTKIDFPWIELKKNVCLTLAEGGILSCESVVLDYTKMTSLFLGHPQIHYSDTMGDIYADRARVDYREVNGSLEATKVILYDNVRLVNQGTTEKPTSQYALADKAYYYPQEQTAILEGKTNRVLFYDQQKDVQISAKTVHVKRNLETNSDTIQGKGDVRFVFGPDELVKIKQRFHIK